jgi:nucleoside transporter
MGIRIRLSAMMFLEYFIWSAWYVTLGTWLGVGLHFDGKRIGLVAGTTAIAAVVSPLFMGAVADRFVAAQKMLAALHLVGGVLLLFAARQHDFGVLYWIFLAYSLCYMPTLALTNAVCFRHVGDVQEQFTGIRVLGTLGWIVAGILVGYAGIEATAIPVRLAAFCSFVMAAYALTLPATPPAAEQTKFRPKALLPVSVLRMLKKREFGVFVAASFLICIPLQFYYAFTNLYLNEIGVHNAAAKMTLGQISELGFMVTIPWFFRRLGVKYMLAAGMLAWICRYLLFAVGDAGGRLWMLYGGIALHGICYDFFFVSGQIYVDKSVPEDVRAAAQGFITLATYGVGMLVGSYLSGYVVDLFRAQAADLVTHHWRSIWMVPALGSALVLIFFLIFFREKSTGPTIVDGQAQPTTITVTTLSDHRGACTDLRGPASSQRERSAARSS